MQSQVTNSQVLGNGVLPHVLMGGVNAAYSPVLKKRAEHGPFREDVQQAMLTLSLMQVTGGKQ